MTLRPIATRDATREMNIIFLSPHSDPEAHLGEVDSGGQCVYEHNLAKSLSRIPGNKVTVYCRRKYDHPAISKVNDNYTIKRITCGGEQFIPKEKIDAVLDEFAIKVATDLIGNPPDIVHGHYWDGGKASILLSNYIKSAHATLWTPHSLGVAKRQKFTGYTNELKFNFISRIAWESYSLMFSNKIIVSTDDEKEKTIEQYAVEPDKIEIVPPGVSEEDFIPVSKQQSRQILDLPQDTPIIVTLGMLERRKGYHNCIKAFGEFKKNTKSPAKLAIFSGKREKLSYDESVYFNELKALAKVLNVEKDVLFRDSVDHDQVRYIYTAGDIYMCLSEYESFGIAILESMITGTPVIATNNGGPLNIIENGVHGFLVNVLNPKDASGRIKELFDNKELHQRISENAKRFVIRNYTWKAKAQEFNLIYKSLLTNSIPKINSVPTNLGQNSITYLSSQFVTKSETLALRRRV